MTLALHVTLFTDAKPCHLQDTNNLPRVTNHASEQATYDFFSNSWVEILHHNHLASHILRERGKFIPTNPVLHTLF